MKVVIQRVSQASVIINKEISGSIKQGILILVGFEKEDNDDDIMWISRKVANLRIFNDDKGVMNLSVRDVGGEILVVSQFTLHAGTKKGNRPTYIKSALPEIAVPLYNRFITTLNIESSIKIETGEFGAMMDVSLTNDGPVTIIIDSKNRI